MVTGYRLITVGHGGCYGRSLQSGESLREVLNFAWERQESGCPKGSLRMNKILVVGQTRFWLESLCGSMERKMLHRKDRCDQNVSNLKWLISRMH